MNIGGIKIAWRLANKNLFVYAAIKTRYKASPTGRGHLRAASTDTMRSAAWNSDTAVKFATRRES